MRLALWFLALAVPVLGIWLLWGGGWESYFSFAGSVLWLENAGRWAWAAGILLLASDVFLPVPGTVVISALGYVYGTLLGGAVASVGLMAAGLLGYGAGRLFGEDFARRWLGDGDYEAGRRLFENGGGWLVALSRALPILPEVISCTAGLVRMPFRRFVTALACGSVPMGFLFAAIGTTGRDAPGWALALSLVIPAVLWLAAGRLRKHSGR
ncbi:VTT domain-containing protein [Luteolibacter yonseiensis]|uniref:VTT domain-containing protein n=1 Tax=Luteolibacter yonseiensis TaxID=1144680 RepID=A0A934R4S8_9BACT|nr:VTT domain-containing protein [Luteolibacter yonseiensis]MBK1816929.1 VTT domain-containing protein [Luteolibacter yonseiensis]